MTDIPNSASPFRPTEWQLLQREAAPAWIRQVLWGLAITLAFTPVVLGVHRLLDIRDVHIVFMVPVVIAATRYGLVSALAVAIVATAISAFFFYEPLYSFRVTNGREVVGLAIFVVIASITSKLATKSRASAAAAAHNMRQVELLYAFSRRLAVASNPDQIFAAVQQHASALVGARVSVLFTEAGRPAGDVALPPMVNAALAQSDAGRDGEQTRLISDPVSGMHWLLRPLPRSLKRSGGMLVDLGRISEKELPLLRREIEPLLEDAASTLERLDLASTVAEVELRRQAEALREAVIGSASHGLRTPLASIMGSASILANSPRIAEDQRHAELAGIIVAEADHLNRDIQKMLDAATLSADAIRPQPGWIEPSDLVNATIEARRRELANHVLAIEYGEGLPLVHVDAAQVRDALGLVIDNAVRYSEPGTRLRIVVRTEGEMVSVMVEDQGVGLDAVECARVLEKFYRGEMVRDATRGSGLGLWIASAFIKASNGRLQVASEGRGKGSRVTLSLVAASDAQMRILGGTDE